MQSVLNVVDGNACIIARPTCIRKSDKGGKLDTSSVQWRELLALLAMQAKMRSAMLGTFDERESGNASRARKLGQAGKQADEDPSPQTSQAVSSGAVLAIPPVAKEGGTPFRELPMPQSSGALSLKPLVLVNRRESEAKQEAHISATLLSTSEDVAQDLDGSVIVAHADAVPDSLVPIHPMKASSASSAHSREILPARTVHDVLSMADSSAREVGLTAKHGLEVEVSLSADENDVLRVSAASHHGALSASVATSDCEQHVSLQADLPQMMSYLSEHDLHVRSIRVASIDETAAMSDLNQGGQRNREGPERVRLTKRIRLPAIPVVGSNDLSKTGLGLLSIRI